MAPADKMISLVAKTKDGVGMTAQCVRKYLNYSTKRHDVLESGFENITPPKKTLPFLIPVGMSFITVALIRTCKLGRELASRR